MRAALPHLLLLSFLDLALVGCAAPPADPATAPLRLFATPPRERDPDAGPAAGDANVFSVAGRRLAVRVVSERRFVGDPPRSEVEQRLSLTDLGDAQDRFSARCPLEPGVHEVELEDGRRYRVKLRAAAGRTQLEVAGAGGEAWEPSAPGQPRLPTVEELFELRARLAALSPTVVTLAERTYRVTRERGAREALLFWSTEALAAAEREGFRGRLGPDYLAEVGERGPDGLPRRITDEAPLGLQAGGTWWGVRYVVGSWLEAKGPEYRPVVAGEAFRLVIPTRRKGGHHLLPVTLIGPRGEHTAEIMVDTGATQLVLPTSWAPGLGFALDELRPAEAATANGPIRVYEARLKVRLEGRGGIDELSDVRVCFGDARVLGEPLLGMSVLGRYKLTIDDQRSELVLERRR
ncbi:MAG: TIGR02281 family clan AA aspartic protease [Planctomycetota bacterium]